MEPTYLWMLEKSEPYEGTWPVSLWSSEQAAEEARIRYIEKHPHQNPNHIDVARIVLDDDSYYG